MRIFRIGSLLRALGLPTLLLVSASAGCASSPESSCNDDCWNNDNCESGLVCSPVGGRWVCIPPECATCVGSKSTCVYQDNVAGNSCSFVQCQ